MKPGWKLRGLFPPYQIAVAGMQIHLIFFALAVLLAIIDHSALAVGLSVLFSIIGRSAAEWGTACPVCGKSPMRYYLTDWGERQGGMPFGSRLWPEQECSRCRTPLDIL